MLSNSVIAAAVASGYLITLFLQLNPSVSIEPTTLLPRVTFLALAYDANLSLLFSALFLLWQVYALKVLSPGWVRVRLLSWLCSIALFSRAALMCLSLLVFGDCLDRETRDRMFVG